jgi:hypothetical protein
MKLLLPKFVANNTGSVVSLSDRTFFGQTVWPTTAWAGIKFDSDGNLYERQEIGGAWSRYGVWLVNGTASNYYLSRTIDSGSDLRYSGDVKTW